MSNRHQHEPIHHVTPRSISARGWAVIALIGVLFVAAYGVVAVLYNAGVYDAQPFVEKAVQYFKKQLSIAVDNSGHHYYAHLYWSQALYQRGGDDWADYYKKATAYLLKQQRKDGSWEGDGVGAVYGTAIALTILQLPWAYVPIYQR